MSLVRSLLALAVGLGSLSSGCDRSRGSTATDGPARELLPVRVEILARRPYQRVARAVATVEPWKRLTLRAEAAGRVVAIRHDVGDRVKRTSLLARLDGSVAWRSFQASRVGVRQAQVALRMAKINLARSRRLRASGDIPQAQLDQAQNAFDRAKAAVDMARAQTAQVGRQLGSYWLRAPMSGLVAVRSVNVGDFVTPGAPMFTLVQMERVKVVVGLDPTEGLLLKKEMPATVSVKTVRGLLERDARVHLVRPLADPATRRVEVELSVPNGDLLLKPGVIARVAIPLGEPSRLLLAPADAVVELVGRRYVYAVRGGRARRLEVKLGVSAGDRVELLPVGPAPLREGEPLVVVGVGRLVPGARVKVVSGAGPLGSSGVDAPPRPGPRRSSGDPAPRRAPARPMER